MLDMIISVLVGLVLIIGAVSPMTYSLIAELTKTYNITGFQLVLWNLVPSFLALAALILIISLITGSKRA